MRIVLALCPSGGAHSSTDRSTLSGAHWANSQLDTTASTVACMWRVNWIGIMDALGRMRWGGVFVDMFYKFVEGLLEFL